MRIKQKGNDKHMDYDNWLKQIGNGSTCNDESEIELPRKMCSQVKMGLEEISIQECITYTFGDLKKKNSESTQWMEMASKHAILCPTN